VDEYDGIHAANLKKLQKKNEELEKLREKLITMEEAHTIALTKAETELHQLKKSQEKEKADYLAKLDQDKRLIIELKNELVQQQNENTKLMDLIDRQKFDLDEARSGLRYYASTPPIPTVK
jgi:ribosome-binding ATPase YchF (GTP1/OBG family)